MSAPRQYAASDIRAALTTMAKIIVLHGDKYLPLFERLECELMEAEKRETTLARVKAMAENV